MLFKESAEKYFEFIANVGTQVDDSFMEEAASKIFAQDVRKIVNGSCVADGLANLLEQLLTARKSLFPWSMTALGENSMFVDTEKSVATICYEASAPQVGTFVIMKNLKIAEGKILSINEVFNKKSEDVVSRS